MSPNLRSPVHVQKPVSIQDAGTRRSEVGRRRIFVQIETGNVVGLDFDRRDKVDSLKKKVQAALLIPTEQSQLLFGDDVIENDLRAVRNDSTLLLTRSLYRTSSSPCLSPTPDISRSNGWSKAVELVGSMRCSLQIKRLIRECAKAIECGIDPVVAGGGLGGAYCLRDCTGEKIAIAKPTDEEPFAPNNPAGFVGKVLGQPGLKRSIRVGESGVREVAAYLLDHKHLAKVPATALVKVAHPVFHVNKESNGAPFSHCSKIASLQEFVKHDCSASDHGTSRYPVSAVHAIGILDVRIFNTDRHAGNILVKKCKDEARQDGRPRAQLQVGDTVELIPIDHGLCLPEELEDPYFEWLHWPQASMSFTEDEQAYISNLDPYKDAEMLRKELPMIREACLRILILSTVFLQRAAAAGLCLSDIGSMMSRQLYGMDEEESELETVCMLAKLKVDEDLLQYDEDCLDMAESSEEHIVDQIQFDMDHEEPYTMPDNQHHVRSPMQRSFSPLCSSPVSSYGQGLQSVYGKCFRLQEMDPVEEGAVKSPSPIHSKTPNSCWRSGSLRYSDRHQGHNSFANSVHKTFACDTPYKSRNNIAGENAFSLSEMSDKEWLHFMEHFEHLLKDSFAKHRRESLHHLQRLGTSCQF